jgi:hypothetical protein
LLDRTLMISRGILPQLYHITLPWPSYIGIFVPFTLIRL